MSQDKKVSRNFASQLIEKKNMRQKVKAGFFKPTAPATSRTHGSRNSVFHGFASSGKASSDSPILVPDDAIGIASQSGKLEVKTVADIETGFASTTGKGKANKMPGPKISNKPSGPPIKLAV